MPPDIKTAADLLLAREADLAADFYLKASDVARRWRTTDGYLRDLRAKGKGPAFVKLSHGRVMYRASDILKYEADGYVRPTPHLIGKSGKNGWRA